MNEKERESKQRALKLWNSNEIDKMEVGTSKGLQKIHAYLFHDLEGYHAGQIHNIN